MPSRLIRTSLAALGCAFLCMSVSPWRLVLADERVTALKVPAKLLPVPTTVSPELQRVISQPVAPQVPGPKTADAWRELQRSRDSGSAVRARAAAKSLGATVELTKVAGVRCYRVTPKVVADEHRDRLLVHLHGGAFVFNGGEAATLEAVSVADACRTSVLSVDYRMPPDHPFPAALDDAVAVWKAVLRDRDAKKTALFGTSAGGGLVMSTVLRLRAAKTPLPGALFLGTPVSDCSKTGDTYFLNAEVDRMLGRYDGFLEGAFKLYANGRDLREPLVSPIYGDLAGFPPTILISGTRDLFLSNTIRAHRKLRRAAVVADLHVYEGQSHADFLASHPAPESNDALREIAQFFDKHLAR